MNSDMVADLSSYDSRLVQQATSATGMFDLPSQPVVLAKKVAQQIALAPAGTRWKVRDSKGRAAWRADLDDRIAALDLYDTSQEAQPTFEAVRLTFPHLSGYDLYDTYLDAVAEYNAENTALYHLVMSTIDLSGPRHDGDMKTIARKFHVGPQRKGKELLEWCENLIGLSDVSGQDDLQVQLTELKLPVAAKLPEFENHCTSCSVCGSKFTGMISQSQRHTTGAFSTRCQRLHMLRLSPWQGTGWLQRLVTKQTCLPIPTI